MVRVNVRVLSVRVKLSGSKGPIADILIIHARFTHAMLCYGATRPICYYSNYSDLISIASCATNPRQIEPVEFEYMGLYICVSVTCLYCVKMAEWIQLVFGTENSRSILRRVT